MGKVYRITRIKFSRPVSRSRVVMRLQVMKLRWLVGGLAVVVLVAGAYWFEPWRLFTTREVDERLPVAASAETPTIGPTTPGASAPSGPVDLLQGRFVSHEHG